ncbi:MAG: excinuclease ABC subunit UvrB [Candidatus Ranarchaeia archaeon]
MNEFRLASDFKPKGGQPKAIRQLVKSIRKGNRFQTLLGVTGSGKTFVMASVIEKLQRPTLVISHNKTLAAQLFEEFREFFPDNAVEYFVSYFSYYQPEAYVPQTDTYIEKDTDLDERLERLRLSAMRSLAERRDVIVVASVSCIFGAGLPEQWRNLRLTLKKGAVMDYQRIIRPLVQMQYYRNNENFVQGRFRVHGDVIDIFPAYDNSAIRVELFGDRIDRLYRFDPLTGETIEHLKHVEIYPARHFVTPEEVLSRAITQIEDELENQLRRLRGKGRLLEAQRLEQRTRFDLEMLRETGYCSGIENYTMHIENRAPGEPPATLLDYFPDDYLTIIDESHVTIPQIRGMYGGNLTRKKTLVQYGFRLPSAIENRPLNFEEFLNKSGQIIFLSATPDDYERSVSNSIIELIIRPTGLVDPEIQIRPTKRQMEHLLAEIKKRESNNERVLVTTLTKRMAENLASYLIEHGVSARYLHSEIDTLKRVTILRDLRLGKFSTLVGINLLREGLDLPEVSLVAVLDADKEGFLRNEVSLIQTMGRAARHINGQVLLFADNVTRSIRSAVDETNRRRRIQIAYNKRHAITPKSISKDVRYAIESEENGITIRDGKEAETVEDTIPVEKLPNYINKLNLQMRSAAAKMEFEKAAEIRDKIRKLKGLIGEADPI